MSWFPDLMQQRLVLVLAHFVWQGILLAVLVAGLLAGLRRGRPGVRYGILLLAFGGLMAAPVLTWVVLSSGSTNSDRSVDRQFVGVTSGEILTVRDAVEISPAATESNANDLATRRVPFELPEAGVMPGISESEVRVHGTEDGPSERHRVNSSNELETVVADLSLVADRLGSATSPNTERKRARRVGGQTVTAAENEGRSLVKWVTPHRRLIVGGWLVGVLLLSSRLILGVIGTAKWRREACLLPESLRSTVVQLCGRMRMGVPLVRTTQQVSEAMVLGLFKPVVLLPAAWVIELPPDMLEAVIAHELAHLRRLDLWVNLVQRIVETLLFYHPAVWWLSRRIRIEREKCCDELAVHATNDRVGYATALEYVARLRLSQQTAAPLVLAMTSRRRGLVLDRVQSLLNEDAHESASTRRVAGMVTLTVAVLLVGVAWFGAELAGQAKPGSASDVKVRDAGDGFVTQRGSLVAMLDDNVKVELFAVYRNGIRDTWWNADGHQRDGEPFDIGMTANSDQPTANWPAVAIRTSVPDGMQLSNVSVSFDNAVQHTTRARGHASSYQSLTAGEFSEDAKTTSVRIQYGYGKGTPGPWHVINTYGELIPDVVEESVPSADLAAWYALRRPHRLSANGDTKTRVLLGGFDARSHVARLDVQLVDVAGRVHDDGNHVGLKRGEPSIEFDVPFERVAHCRYRLVPPLKSVVIRNVSLEVGHVTQPKIEIGKTPTPAERGFGPELRIRAADGSPTVLNHVVAARIGYSRANKPHRAWVGFSNRRNVVSLKDAPLGEQLLLAAPDFSNRTLIRATLPPREFVIDRRMRELAPWAASVRIGPRSTRDSQSFDVRVETADDRTETIVLTAINHHTEPLVIHPEDISLTQRTQRVLSPQLIKRLDEEGTVDDDIVVPPGESVEIPIKWYDWVRNGIWVSRWAEAIDEPWSGLSKDGMWQVRANVRNTGTLPVFATEPKILLAAADLTEGPEGQRTPGLKVVAADGSRADFAGVEVAHVGFLNRERPQNSRAPIETWRGSRTQDGMVLLDKLGNGRHLLVAAPERPERFLFRHAMPPEEVITERRLRKTDKWLSGGEKTGTAIDPYRLHGRIETDGAFEFLVIEATNHSSDPLTIEDDDVTLTTFGLWDHEATLLQSGNFDTLADRVLAPSLLPSVPMKPSRNSWTIPESSKNRLGNPGFGSLLQPRYDDASRLKADPPVHRLVIAPGQTATLRINWTEWVMRGLWCRRPGKVRETWPSKLAPGTVHLRVNLRNRSVLLQSLTHPWLVQMRVWEAQRAAAAATAEGRQDSRPRPVGQSAAEGDTTNAVRHPRPKTEVERAIDGAVGKAFQAAQAAGEKPRGSAESSIADESGLARQIVVNEQSTINELIKALSAQDLNVKAAAAVELGRRKAASMPAAKQLVELLQLKTEHVKVGRYTSALDLHVERALQEIGPVTLPALQQGLDHENGQVRKHCATLIGRFGGESFPDTVIKDEVIISRLINMLGEPNDPERGAAGAASSALKSIGVYDRSMKLAAPHVVGPLMKVLTDGLHIPPPKRVWKNNQQPDPADPLTLLRQRRNYAAGVLAHFAEARAIKPLMAAMESEDRLFRRWAGDALAKMNSPECRQVLAAEETVLRLIDFLRTDDNSQKYSVTRALGYVPKEARGPLLAAIEDKDIRVRQAMLQVCRPIRDDNRILPIVLRRMTVDENLDDPVESRYTERARQLSLLSSHYFELGQSDYRDQVLPLLVEHLKHSDADVRSSAANAMGAIPQPWLQDDRVMSSLIKALNNRPDLYTRQAVIYAMQRLKDERAVLPLIELLGFDELYSEARVPRAQLTQRDRQRYDEQLLSVLCGTLSELGDKRAIPALRLRRERNEPPVLTALGKLGDVDSVPELIKQLKSESRETRLAAANALAGTPDARSVDALAVALRRETGGVFTNRNVSQQRRLATAIAKALSAIGDSRAAEILIAQTRHGSVWHMNSYAQGRPHELWTRTDDHPVARPVADMGAIAIPALINELMLPDFAVVRVQWMEEQTAMGNQVGENGIIEYPPKDSPDAFPEYSTTSSREIAAWALSQMEARGHATKEDLKKAETVLIKSLSRFDEPGLQVHAGRVLGALKTKAAIPALLRVLIASAEKSANVTDVDVDQRERSRGIVFFAPKPETLTAVHFHAAEVADNSARMLSLIGAKTVAVRTALPPLLTHGVAAVRESVIFATVSSDHPQAVALIMPLLNDLAANVRQAAARQLGVAGDQSAVPRLVALIEAEQKVRPPNPKRNVNGFVSSPGQRNPSFDVLSMAARALGMLSGSVDSSANDAVFSLATHVDNRLASHAIMALVQMQDARGVAVLRTAMSSDDARLREEVMTRASFLAMYADLGFGPRITDPDVRAILCDSAENDPSSRVRLYGPGALCGVNDEVTHKTLVTMCDDEASYIRNYSLRYLLDSSYPGRWEMLNRFLTDKAARCRTEAAWHYAELHAVSVDETDSSQAHNGKSFSEGAPGVAESIASVAPLLNDPVADVRDAALRALARLLPLHEEAVPALIETIQELAVSDESANVRHRASRLILAFE